MKTWQLILASVLVSILAGGGYLYTVFKHRQDPGVAGKPDPSQQVSMDDVAVTHQLSAAHFEDTLALQGTSVWVKNGNTIAYFPYTGGHINFARKVGVLPPLQKLDIKKIIKAVPPAKVADGIGHGDRQVFAVFALSGKPDQYAMPIGTIQGSNEFYYCDLMYFYDEPHGIYNYWPKDVWAAIDAHQIKPGMSELQSRLAVGQNMQSDSDREGNRTILYDENGTHWTVTYLHNKATQIKQG